MTKQRIKETAAQTLQKILASLNLNTLIISLATIYFGFREVQMKTAYEQKSKQEEKTASVDSVRFKRYEARWLKVDSNFLVLNKKIDLMPIHKK
jgi:hypothetical protein